MDDTIIFPANLYNHRYHNFPDHIILELFKSTIWFIIIIHHIICKILNKLIPSQEFIINSEISLTKINKLVVIL